MSSMWIANLIQHSAGRYNQCIMAKEGNKNYTDCETMYKPLRPCVLN